MKRFVLVLCAALAGLSAPPSARAADPADAVRQVNFADLDLASPAGEAALHQRLRLAARDVCVAAGVPPDGDAGWDCYHRALRNAERDGSVAVAAARLGSKLAVRVASH